MIVQSEFDFGGKLKEIRLSRGLTQRELGERIGVSGNLVSNWEMGGHGMPRLELFRMLCIALNCLPGDLLGLSPSQFSADEYSLVKGYRELSDAGRYTMLTLLGTQLKVSPADPTPEE